MIKSRNFSRHTVSNFANCTQNSMLFLLGGGRIEGKRKSLCLCQMCSAATKMKTFAFIFLLLALFEISLGQKRPLTAQKVGCEPCQPESCSTPSSYECLAGKKNYKIPKDKVAENLDLSECLEIIENQPKKTRGKRKASK